MINVNIYVWHKHIEMPFLHILVIIPSVEQYLVYVTYWGYFTGKRKWIFILRSGVELEKIYECICDVFNISNFKE